MEREKLEMLFKTHYMEMYRLARTIVYDEEECKDVVSEVFTQLLCSHTTIKPETARSYLLTSVRNRCYNALEHRQLTERIARLFTAESAPVGTTADDNLMLDDLLQYLDNQLPVLTQQIFRLRFLQEMTYQEVAEATGVSKVTVYSHLVQATQKINDYFKIKPSSHGKQR